MFTPITQLEFQARTQLRDQDLCRLWQSAETVVPLRLVKQITTVSDMPKEYLRALIDSISLVGDPQCFPYKGHKIDLVRHDPQQLRIGQKFVEENKCLNLIDDFLYRFWDFAGTRGFAKLTAKVIFGNDEDGQPVVAHYLPPIIEEHQASCVLLDGIHRNFIARGIGTTLESLIIRDVQVTFPCDWHKWTDIQRVKEKPPLEQRFFNLQPPFFRNLKSIGIDG